MSITKPDLSIVAWRSSSYSGNGGTCVQVPATQPPGTMPVRDSKAPGRTPLAFPHSAWASFVIAVAATEGDLHA
jgi:hypothetical protein